jgi:hypothetical protein
VILGTAAKHQWTVRGALVGGIEAFRQLHGLIVRSRLRAQRIG